MRAGYYSDKYFVRTREILQADGDRPHVTMQVFGKQHAFLGGIDEAIAILKLCSDRWPDLVVHALHDGDAVEPWETVLLIEGPYDTFAHLETLYLGVLARRTKVGTNTRRVVEAAAPKEVMFFPARHDHWLVQTGDGYAAHIAGAIGVSTDAQASWWGSEGVGTVPHALIAAYGGDTVRATQKFAQYMPPSVRLVTLVDFENDCVRTALEVAEALGDRLYGVRIDTSEMLVDRSLFEEMGRFRPTGVNPRLVENVRAALDSRGFSMCALLCRAASRWTRSASSSGSRCRWTPTAWARRSSRVASTSPPTWCCWMESPVPRWAAATAPIRAWSA